MKYLFVLLLAGCSSLPKVPDKIYLPVTQSCISQQADKPDFTSHEQLKQLSVSDYVLQVTAELLKYESYTLELEALLKSCK